MLFLSLPYLACNIHVFIIVLIVISILIFSVYRRYEVAVFDVSDPWDKLPVNIGKLVRCLTAPNFFDFIECLTGEILSGQEGEYIKICLFMKSISN